jgi:cytochrome c
MAKLGRRTGAARVAPASVIAALLLGLAAAHLGPAHATDAAYGEYLSSECTACHRRDGENKGIPSIIGWPAERFIAALKAYKSKVRPNEIMQTITGRLSDEDMSALAAFYGSLAAPQ